MKKLLGIVVLGLILVGCKTIVVEKDQPNDPIIIQNLTEAKSLGIDFECYNLCKDSVKQMKLSQLHLFCKMQCPLK